MGELNNLAKTTVKGGLFLFFGVTSSTLILAVTSIIVARLLGPEDYGLYTIILVVPTLFTSLCDLGVSPALTRFSAHYRAQGRDGDAAAMISAGMRFKIPFSILVSLILLLLADGIAAYVLNRPGAGPLIKIASIYLFSQAVLDSVNAIFVGLDDAGKSGLLLFITSVARIAASPLLIILGFGVAGALFGIGIGSLLAVTIGVGILLIYTVPVIRKNDPLNGLSSSEALKTMTRYGAPLYASDLILSSQGEFRRIFLAIFTSNEKIGNYQTALNFSALINVLSSPIASVLLPTFSKISVSKDKANVAKLFRLSVKYTSLIIIPASVSLIVLSSSAVHLLYGSQYQAAPFYLALYMLNFLLTGIGMYVMEALLNSQGETGVTFKIKIINVSALPLALILIPMYGPEGLIVSVLISQLISTAYGLHLIHRKYAMIPDWVSSLRIIAASASSAIPVYLFLILTNISHNLLSLGIGAIIYAVALLIFLPLFGALNGEDIRNLRKLFEELPIFRLIIDGILRIESEILTYTSRLRKISGARR